MGGGQARPCPRDRVAARSLAGRARIGLRSARRAPPDRIWPRSGAGADAGAVTSPPLLRNYSVLDSRSSVSETAPRRSASLASAARRCVVAGRDAELVVQVREVLLDGGLGDDELVGDRARGRGLGEHVAREQRAAEGDEHVALARRQAPAAPARPRSPRRRRASGSRNTSRVWPIRISSPCRNRREAQIRSPLTHVPLEEPRSVTHQPAAKPLEHRVQAAGRRVVVDGDVVLGGLADRRAVGGELEAPAAHAGDHLDLR